MCIYSHTATVETVNCYAQLSESLLPSAWSRTAAVIKVLFLPTVASWRWSTSWDGCPCSCGIASRVIPLARCATSWDNATNPPPNKTTPKRKESTRRRTQNSCAPTSTEWDSHSTPTLYTCDGRLYGRGPCAQLPLEVIPTTTNARGETCDGRPLIVCADQGAQVFDEKILIQTFLCGTTNQLVWKLSRWRARTMTCWSLRLDGVQSFGVWSGSTCLPVCCFSGWGLSPCASWILAVKIFWVCKQFRAISAQEQKTQNSPRSFCALHWLVHSAQTAFCEQKKNVALCPYLSKSVRTYHTTLWCDKGVYTALQYRAASGAKGGSCKNSDR